MTGPASADFEGLLRRALAPVEPPIELAERLEGHLRDLNELAVDELEGWELRAMRDPRKWVRPAAALVVGASSGTALVLLRARRQRAEERHGSAELVQRTASELIREARRLLPSSGGRGSTRRPPR